MNGAQIRGGTSFESDVVIVGGCGHVGLPLGIALAGSGLQTILFDIDSVAVHQVNGGNLPFKEDGALEVLKETVRTGYLQASTDPTTISRAELIIVVIGTPIDEHLNPDPEAVPRAILANSDQLRDGQALILRSTVYPGVTSLVEQLIADLGLDIDIAFCPERIAEGKAMTELYELPQIVGSRTDSAAVRASSLFQRLTTKIVHLTPEEAELAKLFTNTWRYIKFATANQLYMIANDFDLDYERIRAGLAEEYPRAADLPRAGFAAGPCLFKDTMQLAAFNNNNFTLGHASMMVNEGLPLYVVSRVSSKYRLDSLVVGILGMAFKADTDDTRSSLSYKLRRILRFKAREVICADPFVTGDDSLLSEEEVLERADLLIIGAPHKSYTSIKTEKPMVDIWGITGRGVYI
jgi:UDP-N-acetyl-D-mannosaminuronic acid dehydrogenase